MSIPKINGRQARELLDIWAGDVEDLIFAQLGADRNYGDLFGAAPALAETVAWLYGREADELHGDHTVTWKPGPSYAGFEVDACKEPGEKVQLSVTSLNRGDWVTIYADEAVELARALLAAAEEARDE